MVLHIRYIEPQKMILSDELSDDSEWQPLPGLDFPPSWKIGDEVATDKKGGRFSLWRLSNNTRKQEAGGVPASISGDIKKSLNSIDSEKEYTNLDKEIRIKKAEGELIWLKDDSKWHMYLPALGDPGSWDIGHSVIVSRPMAKNKESKKYRMKNIETDKDLIALFLGYER